MADIEDLSGILFEAVHDYISRRNQLARAFFFSRPTQIRKHLEPFDAFENALGGLPRGLGIVLPDVINNVREFGRWPGCSSELGSRAEKLVDMADTTSSCSTRPPWSAAAMPRSTPSIKRARRSSMLLTVSATTCAAFLPLRAANCLSRASVSGVKWTSLCFQRLALPIVSGKTKTPGIKIQDTRLIRLMEVLLNAGTQLNGWRTAQVHQAILTAFGLSA